MRTTFTQEQIEAAGLALHQRREANSANRMGRSFIATPYEGDERAFCEANARNDLELAEDQRQQGLAIIASMAHMTDADIKHWVDLLSVQASDIHYALATHTAIQDQDRDSLNRYRQELIRRDRVRIEANNADTDKMLDRVAALHAETAAMNAPALIAAE